MKIGSLFSGYGGLDMGVGAALGASTSWFVEFDRAPSQILNHHWPDIPNHGDITAIDWRAVEPIDILTGGFPCQDVSTAGLRRGLRRGTRSGLWSHFAEGIDILRPQLVVIENVRGLLSASAHSDMESCAYCLGNDDEQPALRALGAVLGDLADLGYHARWSGFRAADAGAPHGRFRVFITAWPAGDAALDSRHRARYPQYPIESASAEGPWDPAERARQSGRVSEPAADAERVESERRRISGELEGSAGDRARAAEEWQRDGHAALDRHARYRDVDAAHADSAHERRQRRRESRRARIAAAAHDRSADRRREAAPLEDPRDADDISGDGQLGSPAWHGLESSGADRRPAADADHGIGQSERRELGIGIADRQDPPAGAQQHWGPYAAAIRRWELVTGRIAPAPTDPSPRDGKARLSPRFVEWMMGLPAGHVTDPAIGLTRAEQLKALGNGVVPQQAELAIRSIILDLRS